LTPAPHEMLPIDEAVPEVRAALAEGQNAVIVAPPGAGKTTRLPLVFLAEPWATSGKIILLEPRRLAARGAAERMASQLGESVGDTVGLRVRLGSRIGRRTRLEVVTEGVFTRMIVDDPELRGVAAIIFDEFHERSLDADLGLALALDAQSALRPDLRIIAMSATLDGARVASLLKDAPVIASAGRAFPVTTRYLGRDPTRRIEAEVADAVTRALEREDGSILVFLPGQGEIRRVETQLRERIADPAVDIAPLYGALTQKEQDAAVLPTAPGRRKVVLATSIAETSLTIQGVRVVVDSGLARVPRYEPGIGLTRLETVPVSRASADQRRGRAGRTEPGVCYRLWDEAATGSLKPYSAPEILAADLSSLLLDCAEWGVTDPGSLAFLDKPPASALNEARGLLTEVGALDAGGRITNEGRRLRALPLPPRLAHMVVAAPREEAPRAAQIAALLVERGLGGNDVDLLDRFERFGRDRSQRADDMRRLARGWANEAARDTKSAAPSAMAFYEAGALLALAYPDRIAKGRGKGGEFLMANGRAAAVDGTSPLAREPFIVVAEVAGSAAAGRILLAAPLSVVGLDRVAGHRVTTREEIFFDRGARGLKARTVRRLGAIVLDERPLPVPATPEAAAALARGIAEAGIAHLPWGKALQQWRDRLVFLRRAEGDDWPDVSDVGLKATIDTWLAPSLAGKSRLSEISTADLEAAVKGLLPWRLKRRLDQDAPTYFEVPTGSRIAIDYEAEGGPAIAVRVQELFGLDRHPTIADGRVPLVLNLLSPAQRPIQITRDLPGFWRGSWAQVKAEMRGRYPKHPWPDDPLAAPPTRRAKRPGDR
jgi:ATP-dependent helicase HrpB